MNPSKFFVPAAVAATVVAVATLAYAQNTTTSPTATHPAVQGTAPAQPMPADSTTSPTTAHPAMQGGQGQPMPADSTKSNPGSTSATGGMSPGPSTTGTPSTSAPVTTTAPVVPADNGSMITERPARSDRG